MDSIRRKRLQAKLRMAAVVTATYEDTKTTKKLNCCRHCNWIKFGYIVFVVMLCLGVALLIVGGVCSITGLLILGGVFVVGSFVFLSVVCAPSINCGRHNRVNGVTNEITEHVEITPERPRVMLTRKRPSFLKGILASAVSQETKKRSSISEVQSFDRSWVKMVEKQQAKNSRPKSAIEEEPNTTVEIDNQTDANVQTFQNETTDDRKVKSNVNSDLQRYPEDMVNVRRTTIDDPDVHVTEGNPVNERNKYMYGGRSVPSPSRRQTQDDEKHISDNRSSRSSQLTVNTRTRVSDTGENANHYRENPMDEQKLSDANGDFIEPVNEMVQTQSERKKKSKKRKRKKDRDMLEEVDFESGAYTNLGYSGSLWV